MLGFKIIRSRNKSKTFAQSDCESVTVLASRPVIVLYLDAEGKLLQVGSENGNAPALALGKK